MRMKTIAVLTAVAAMLTAGCGGDPSAAAKPAPGTVPETLDAWGCIRTDGLLTASYLFDTVFTNRNPTAERPVAYASRIRGIVDLDGDGADDVILSDSFFFATAHGLGYYVFLQTNGLYRCIGAIGAKGRAWVESWEDGATFIWSYMADDATHGTYIRTGVRNGAFASEIKRPVSWSADGVCNQKWIPEHIRNKATVPVRWEYSETKDGVNTWLPL